jgi:hypothetical protein
LISDFGITPTFPFSAVTDLFLMASDAFIHAGFNTISQHSERHAGDRAAGVCAERAALTDQILNEADKQRIEELCGLGLDSAGPWRGPGLLQRARPHAQGGRHFQRRVQQSKRDAPERRQVWPKARKTFFCRDV